MIYTYLYIIKRKQIYTVFSLCKETYLYLHQFFKLQMCIIYLLFMFVTNTKVEWV